MSNKPQSPISKRYHRLHQQRDFCAAVAVALYHACDELEDEQLARKLKKTARRLDTCSSSTVIRLQTPVDDETRIVINNKRECRNHLCMSCARRRAAQTRKKLGDRLDHIAKAHPEARYAFLTLTARNRPVAEAGDMFRAHEEALERFFRTKRIKAAVLGHATGIEFALREGPHGREVGVHSHSLLVLHGDYFNLTSSIYLKQQDIVAIWQQALRASYQPICDVRAIPADSNVRHSLRECIKYAFSAAKCFDRKINSITADPTVVLALARALYKRRLVRFNGVFSPPRKSRQGGAA